MTIPETDYIDQDTFETLEEAHLKVDDMLRKIGVNVPKDINKPYPPIEKRQVKNNPQNNR